MTNAGDLPESFLLVSAGSWPWHLLACLPACAAFFLPCGAGSSLLRFQADLIAAGTRPALYSPWLQGNFDDLVGYEEDCSPESLLETSSGEPAPLA